MKPSMQSRILPHGWLVIGAQVKRYKWEQP